MSRLSDDDVFYGQSGISSDVWESWFKGMQDVLATKYHALGNLKIGMSIGSNRSDLFERNRLYLWFRDNWFVRGMNLWKWGVFNSKICRYVFVSYGISLLNPWKTDSKQAWAGCMLLSRLLMQPVVPVVGDLFQ
jgi:hypothetical protein